MSRPESAVPAVGAGSLRLLVLEVDGPAAGHLVVASRLLRHWLREQGCRPPDWLDGFEAAAGRVIADPLGAARSGQERPPLGAEAGMADGGRVTTPLLLSYEQAAEQLGISERAVRRLASTGELVTVSVGRSRRIHRDDLEQYAGSLRPNHPTPAAPGPDVLRGHRARFNEGA